MNHHTRTLLHIAVLGMLIGAMFWMVIAAVASQEAVMHRAVIGSQDKLQPMVSQAGITHPREHFP